ncbi:MAG: hypothetical protein R3301_20005 [Saprospiraceae bacterium]|nr:hypothetical protein [Saprospiraceae bacterium]
MSIINIKIKRQHIHKDAVYPGEKYTYLNLSVARMKEPDQYGNTHSVYYYDRETKEKHYCGNGKEFVFEDEQAPPPQDAWNPDDTNDDLPF